MSCTVHREATVRKMTERMCYGGNEEKRTLVVYL